VSDQIYRLLASSGTIAGIESCVCKFWDHSSYCVDPVTLQITHPFRNVPERVRIVKKAKRYRFEVKS